jgi:tRNA(Ile)-lysidine synthase
MSVPSDLHDLPPQWAHLCLDVERFVTRELGLDPTGGRILLGVSAGVDSAALLLVCRVLQRRWGTSFFAAHLDHRLRPGSEQEAQEVRSLCRELEIPLTAGSSNVSLLARRTGAGVEEAGRRMRYRFLHGVRRKLDARFLLTAHHLNDLGEDVLMRLLRGTGWPALSGMRAWIPETGLLRPLLLTPKESLRSFVRDAGLSWREDESNRDLSFQRNRVRHKLLPLAFAENPAFLDAVRQLWRQGRTDQGYWERCLDRVRGSERAQGPCITLPARTLADAHAALRLRWYRDVLNRLGPGQVLADNLFRLDAAWSGGSTGKTLQFPGGKRARITRAGIEFSPAGQDGRNQERSGSTNRS